jgi:hypothetical protein
LIQQPGYSALDPYAAARKVISVNLRNPHGPAGADATVTVTGDQLFASVGEIGWGTVI